MLKPMLAAIAEAPLADPQFAYEPKYDGIRAIVEVPAGGDGVRIWSRLGNDKTAEFSGIAQALAHWASRRKAPVVLDGEVVALDTDGRPAGFQHLQRHGPAAFIAFDVLRDGDADLRARRFTDRRTALERLFARTGSDLLRISEIAYGDGRALYARALSSGWEGLVAKRVTSRYLSGKRSSDWRKLKIVHEQEFVIGGWTEPRHSRAHFGALLLGVHETTGAASRRGRPGPLVYVGHVGTGFDAHELERLMQRFAPLATDTCPFREPPPGNERPHWLTPTLVAQVKFTEWTADGALRHPVYLGLREDAPAATVTREPAAKIHAASDRLSPALGALVEQLHAIERGKGDGTLALPGGTELPVTNLRKIFWPALKFTKGDLLRYYVQASPYILPAVADRPLVMKRFPNGIAAAPFYQHRVEHAPAGVRVAEVPVDEEMRPQFIGGDLATLLHMTQLAAISQDPWFSRVQSLDAADYVALDLDPSDGVGFSTVLDVARWIHDELEQIGLTGIPKTSGASGLHIYLPMPAGTPYDAGLLICQIVATVVAQAHPKQASIERFVKARGKTVYVDYLQNIQGKTLATAYSARASEYAGVSTPLTWTEVHAGIDREMFTIATAPDRFRTVGDLWAPVRKPRKLDLERIARYTRGTG